MVEDLKTDTLGYALQVDYEDYLWNNQNENNENDMKCSKKFYAFDANEMKDLCNKNLSYFINKQLQVLTFLNFEKF